MCRYFGIEYILYIFKGLQIKEFYKLMEYSVKKVDSFYVYILFFGNNLNVFCIFEVIFWCCKILRLRFGKMFVY